jgi:hypothetical protein
MKGKFEFYLAAHALLKQANNRAPHAAQDPALERFASDPHLLAHATADVTFGQSLDLVFRAPANAIDVFETGHNHVQ